MGTDLQGLEATPKRNLRDILGAANQRISDGQGIPADEFWRQVEQETRMAKEPTRKRTANREPVSKRNTKRGG